MEKYLGKYCAFLETQNKCTKNKKMVSQVGGLSFLHLPLILSTVIIWPSQWSWRPNHFGTPASLDTHFFFLAALGLRCCAWAFL